MQRFPYIAATALVLLLAACGGQPADDGQTAAPQDAAAPQGLSAEEEAQLEQAYQQQAASAITADNAEQVAAELEAAIAADSE